MSKRLIKAGDPTQALIHAIAMDIGKEAVHHLETMYPAAIKACSSTMKLSLRNCIHNEIMDAIKTTDEGEIIARIAERKKRRGKNYLRKIQKAALKRAGI